MNQRNIWGFLVAVLVVVGALGFFLDERFREARAHVVAGELLPIAVLLEEDYALSWTGSTSFAWLIDFSTGTVSTGLREGSPKVFSNVARAVCGGR